MIESFETSVRNDNHQSFLHLCGWAIRATTETTVEVLFAVAQGESHMNSKSTLRDEGTDVTGFDPSSSKMTSVVTDWRRRAVLTHLRDNGAVQLSELASYLAREKANAEGRGPTRSDERRTRVALHHVDVPLLADVGMITYDTISQIVSPTPTVDRLGASFFITE